MFWTLLGSIGFIVGITIFTPIVLDKVYSIYIKRTMYNGCFFILPLLFVFFPLIINIHRALSLDHRGKKLNVSFFAIILILFCIEGFALSYWIVDNKYVEIDLTAWIKLLLYESPLCLLLLSPAVILYRKKKKATPWNIATAIYCYFEVVAVVLLAIGENHHWYNTENEETFMIPWMITCGCICVLYAFYGIQYMRQPKEQTLITYCNNVLSFQSFKKYKSFGIRLKTIAIVFFVVYVGLTSTSYNDYVPFISLPLCCILVLYAASKEIDMTKKKQVLTIKLLIPVVFLTDLIVGLQYTDGFIKQGIIYLSMLILAIGIFMFFAHQEILKGNKSLIIKLAGVSFLIAFVLPPLCVGYNIFNPSLSKISRVWDGRISSNLTGVNFLTVENDKGEKGVMDYSEIIIAPQFDSIEKRCFISSEMYGEMHPMLKNIKGDLFAIDNFYYDMWHEKDNYLSSIFQEYSSNTEREDYYLSFMCYDTDGTSTKYTDNSFLTTQNKYGRHITEDWLSSCNTSFKKYRSDYETANAILDFGNQNINDVERKNAIIRLFVGELNDFSEKQNLGIEELSALLKKCNTSISLEPLKTYKGPNVSSEMFINAAMMIAPWLHFDQTGALKDLILDSLWNKYVKDSTGTFKPLCLLLANEKAKAWSLISAGKEMSPESMDNISIRCIYYLYTNNKSLADNLIEDYVNSENYNTNEAEKLFAQIAEMHYILKSNGCEIVNDNMIKDVANRLHVDDSYIYVDCKDLNIPGGGGTYYVNVNCLSEWNVEEPTESWIELRKFGNCVEEDGCVEIVVGYNSYDPRKGSFMLTSGKDSIQINIKQDGY